MQTYEFDDIKFELHEPDHESLRRSIEVIEGPEGCEDECWEYLRGIESE